MGVTVQVRDLDPAVDARLKGAATAKGLSYSEYLRRELTRIAERLRLEERWAEVVALDAAATQAAADSRRGPFPDLEIPSDDIVAIVRRGRSER
ncbi:MAG: hypothetical protein J0I18_01065 [Actinobacteria bacterium]|nr:hypothetical protein [Actinomycetota bacterium]